jgi:hypothetical protein
MFRLTFSCWELRTHPPWFPVLVPLERMILTLVPDVCGFARRADVDLSALTPTGR